jgi:hypothetical protein
MPISNIYEEYALLESQIEALELKKEQLRPHILQMMIDKGEKKVDTGVGSFSVSKIKKWTFPARIVEMEENVKAEKEKAKSTNEATYEESESLRFTKMKL